MTPDAQRSADDARTRLDRFLNDSGLAARGAVVMPLAGDVSDRRYFRIRLPHERSQVLAVHTGPIDFHSLPFANVARLMSAMPLPVPAVIDHDDALGIIALQDLGDVTLQAQLATATPDERVTLYRQAVGFIDTLQQRGHELASPDYVPYALAFDVQKLMWELHYFATHFLDGYRRAALTPAAREALTREFSAVVEELAGEPRVLCHRDYHCRNLMVHEAGLHIIDFQDARMGPDTYDLVSLLRDSYVDFTEAEVEALIAHFLGLRAGRPTAAEGPDEFRRRFDLMAVQRNLKALGTFGFQTIARGTTAYEQYIPRTLGHVRSNLGRYPRFARLRELLADHLPELR